MLLEFAEHNFELTDLSFDFKMFILYPLYVLVKFEHVLKLGILFQAFNHVISQTYGS